MAQKEQYFKWEWQLKSSPQALWPFFADTNRVNKDTGLFPVQERDKMDAQPLMASRRRRLRYQTPIPFFHLDYEEDPFEWVYPHRYGVLRQFKKAPISTFRVITEFIPQADGGTHLVYEVWVQPSNVLGSIGAYFALGFVAEGRFGKALRQYDELAQSEAANFVPTKAGLARGGDVRLKQMEQQLGEQGFEAGLVSRLINLVMTADDMTLSRLRPYLCADLWGIERKQVLEMFLWATRIGLLDFQWEVLCPMCRGAEDRVNNRLADVHTEAHCTTCNIDFKGSFENEVELTFAPNPAIRDVERIEYCVAGPEVTPHVVVQQLLPAKDEKVVTPLLEVGRYRIRTMGLPGGQYFRVTENDQGQAGLHIQINEADWPVTETSLHHQPQMNIQNNTADEQLLILERTAWSDQATTAAEVIALQRFRDLFANEALRPGEQVGVGSLTVLFTDLVDSTRMYREIGDAPAFGLVMSHFDVLIRVIDEEDGAIVKTIGDAVMAVFRRPISALKAMVRVQAILANPPEGNKPLYLKAAIHSGPSIAVTLNERLDYFGTTINMAARLEKFCRGNDLILSEAVYDDPEVRAFLEDPYDVYQIEPFSEQLKGFDDEHFSLWRVIPSI